MMNKVFSLIKQIIAKIIRFIFRFIPLSLSIKLTKVVKRIVWYIPSNKEFIYPNYLGDLKVRVNTKYPIERVMLLGYYEELTQFIIEKFVSREDVCFDIGANIGAITLSLAKKVYPEGRVYAFEPGPFLFERLQYNVQLNNSLSQVIVPIKKGFSDKREVLYWGEDEKISGNAMFSEQPGKDFIPLELTTIDEFVEEKGIKEINFMKIDVEGMELNVIRGGIDSIKKFKPILYYETLLGFEKIKNKELFKPIEDMLISIGYELYMLTKEKRIIPTRYPKYSGNTLAIPKDKAKNNIKI